MAKRSCKGNMAYMSNSILRFINVLILAGAIAAIAIVFIIKASPEGPAWAFIVVGLLTVLSALFGIIFGGHFGLCGLHLLAALLSVAGLGAAGIVTLVRADEIQKNLKPTTSESNAKSLVKAEGAVLVVLFLAQVVVLLIMCLMSSCDCYDDYMEMDPAQSAKEAAKMQQEDERRRAKVESTSAHKLAAKMKEKYSQFGGAQSDYDVEGGGKH